MYYFTHYDSPIGKLTIASTTKNIIGLWIENQKYFPNITDDIYVNNGNISILKKCKRWLDNYFNETPQDISELELSPAGTLSQQKVWNILIKIPYGETMTYGNIAKIISSNTGKMCSRAVGHAVGLNPISIIIPCHRVLGYNNRITGYAGGIDKKIQLLKHEGIDINKLKI